MTSVAVELLAISFITVCLYGIKPASPFSSAIHEDYLSIESGNHLRGILSMVVVLHHLSQKVTGLLLFSIFPKIGYLTVSVFFFLSGYGLMKQYMQKENYARKFLLRRLPSILFPYILANFFYWLLSLALGTPLTLQDIINELLWGTPVVTASWYIICIVLFYIGFWALMLLCGKHYRMMLPGSILYCIVYILFCRKAGYSSWWYNTVPVLVLGIVWATYERKLNQLLRKHYWKALPAAFLLFVGVYGIKLFLNSRISGELIHIPLTWCTAGLFVCCILLILMKVKPGNSVLRWLGKISLETYLCHFLFLTLLRSNVIYIENDFFYSAAAITFGLVFAYAWHFVNRLMLNGYAKLLALLP